ncbi:hypothetical protein EDC14_101999 [Hydrogenispora ethanolica]|uniref:Uncharacterized protein n=1 Tax=Hydrogenispora ethanolica TaxID=1082276 RepID=A0A4R1REG4_HYDET|nr:hypothetical protein [Hydrogenispora ethanolica]TCL64293.1 hypothetical protein EDC14_101999 [Hydrogenispora ethanolica]
MAKKPQKNDSKRMETASEISAIHEHAESSRHGDMEYASDLLTDVSQSGMNKRRQPRKKQ